MGIASAFSLSLMISNGFSIGGNNFDGEGVVFGGTSNFLGEVLASNREEIRGINGEVVRASIRAGQNGSEVE